MEGKENKYFTSSCLHFLYFTTNILFLSLLKMKIRLLSHCALISSQCSNFGGKGHEKWNCRKPSLSIFTPTKKLTCWSINFQIYFTSPIKFFTSNKSRVKVLKEVPNRIMTKKFSYLFLLWASFKSSNLALFRFLKL